MRTFGRVTDLYGVKTWVEVDTDAAGRDDAVWVTTLIQCLKLAPGESPFYANYGIPAHPSVVQQLFPDYYVAQTQRQFSGYFASLVVAKVNAPEPTYDVNIVTHVGVRMNVQVPV